MAWSSSCSSLSIMAPFDGELPCIFAYCLSPRQRGNSSPERMGASCGTYNKRRVVLHVFCCLSLNLLFSETTHHVSCGSTDLTRSWKADEGGGTDLLRLQLVDLFCLVLYLGIIGSALYSTRGRTINAGGHWGGLLGINPLTFFPVCRVNSSISDWAWLRWSCD